MNNNNYNKISIKKLVVKKIKVQNQGKFLMKENLHWIQLKSKIYQPIINKITKKKQTIQLINKALKNHRNYSKNNNLCKMNLTLSINKTINRNSSSNNQNNNNIHNK